MTTKCVACGKFIPYSQMGDGGGARFHFVPDNEFGPEVSEWTCAACTFNKATLRGRAERLSIP
jgi:hypothetical protein